MSGGRAGEAVQEILTVGVIWSEQRREQSRQYEKRDDRYPHSQLQRARALRAFVLGSLQQAEDTALEALSAHLSSTRGSSAT